MSPCMEAAPKLNIIFCSASCLLNTPESHCLHLTSLHKHISSFWKSLILFCILSSGQLYHIIHYIKSQEGQSSARGGGGGGECPPPPLNEALPCTFNYLTPCTVISSLIWITINTLIYRPANAKPRQGSRKRKAGQTHPAPQAVAPPPTTNQAREITGAVLNLLSEILLTGLDSDGSLELSFATLGALVAETGER